MRSKAACMHALLLEADNIDEARTHLEFETNNKRQNTMIEANKSKLSV
jgi:hypothetical protein